MEALRGVAILLAFDVHGGALRVLAELLAGSQAAGRRATTPPWRSITQRCIACGGVTGIVVLGRARSAPRAGPARGDRI
jgi:hypothetical protein